MSQKSSQINILNYIKTLSHPKRVLIFIDWFYPAYKAGGPIKSVYNLIKGLNEEFNFSIICSNLEMDNKVLDLIPNKWTFFEEIPIIYLSKPFQNSNRYNILFDEVKPDLIYYNSLFSKQFTLMPYLLFKKKGVRQVIAPRGMLGKASLEIKPLKKWAFLALAKRFLFQDNLLLWHATSIQEEKDITQSIGKKAKIKMARNLASPILKRNLPKEFKSSNSLRLVFISRIVPIKNLDFLLQVFKKINNHSVTLDIYGPREDAPYWEYCSDLINQLPNVHYKGELSPLKVKSKLQEYHFSVLPTKHENFGNSIVESWLSGVPVLISDKTPWVNLERKCIGKELSIKSAENWTQTFERYLSLNQEQYIEFVKACRIFARDCLHEESILHANKMLFSKWE